MGGRNALSKVLGIFRAFQKITELISVRDGVALYHMITWPIWLFGLIFKLSGWKQGVWYSHHHADFALRSTTLLVDRFFSPTTTTFPIKVNKKLVATGHSLNFSNISAPKENRTTRQLNSIYCIGRIAPVKRIELLLRELAMLDLEDRKKISVKLIGPAQSREYMEFLKEEAAILQINLLILGPMLRSDLLKFLEEIEFIFNGTPKSVDKAALEACASGAILITNNIELCSLTGMDSIWENVKPNRIPTILEQVQYLSNIGTKRLIEIANHVQVTTRFKNDYFNTIKVIERELR
jgi:glycosyltransferase involved in cell wall biosynthesis